jgi:hypothetical protein
VGPEGWVSWPWSGGWKFEDLIKMHDARVVPEGWVGWPWSGGWTLEDVIEMDDARVVLEGWVSCPCSGWKLDDKNGRCWQSSRGLG